MVATAGYRLAGPTHPSDLTTIPTLKRETITLLGTVLRGASPVFSVASSSAPMLIVQGSLDTAAPAGQSLELLRALHQRGVPVGYVAYAGGDGFSGLTLVK